MGGAELVLKFNQQVWLFKVSHDGQAIEDFLIKQKRAFAASPDKVLADLVNYFGNNYYQTGLELNTFYPRGFHTYLGFTDIKSSDSIEEMIYSIETMLHHTCIEKDLNPDDEDMLICMGEYISLLVDYDTGKIWGAFDDNGDSIILDKDFNATKEVNS